MLSQHATRLSEDRKSFACYSNCSPCKPSGFRTGVVPVICSNSDQSESALSQLTFKEPVSLYPAAMASRKKGAQVIFALDSAEALQKVIDDSEKYLAVVDIHYGWCGPTEVMAPVIR